MGIETEIKLEVAAHGNLASRLDFISHTFKGGDSHFSSRGRERDSYIDFGKKLSRDNISLRVREYCNTVTITKKKKGNMVGGVKSRPEVNLPIDASFITVLDFFKDIGASEAGYYEKEDRAIYKINYQLDEEYIVCLDTILDKLKERHFVEIEGPSKDRILEIAQEMGIYEREFEAKVMEKSYSQLFARKRR